MADQRISQLPAITGANMADTDQFVVARASTSENFSVTRAEVFKDIPTLDATTLEVTNLKAKDGTAAGSIANTTGVVTLASSVLTTTDINGGTIDGTTIGGVTPAAGSFTTASTTGDLTISDKIVHSGDTNTAIRFPAADTVTVETAGAERVRIDSAGNLGLGVTPSAWGSGGKAFQVGLGGSVNGSTSSTIVGIASNQYYDGSSDRYITTNSASAYTQFQSVHRWFTAPSGTAGNPITFTQAMTLDASGNLGIGTTSALTRLHVFDAAAASSSPSVGVLLVRSGDNAGDKSTAIQFDVGGGGGQARIYTERLAGFGGNLIFAPANTSGAFPERARITSDGNLLVGRTNNTLGTVGSAFGQGTAQLEVNNASSLYINRIASDGNLVEFYQASTLEGTISVSGTTVSYNGGHLSRWAQFPDNSRPELLKGTVMSNLDQMSDWDGEENEQLNCVQISTVEGDPNVAGVFVAWDSTDDEYNDILLAMTGDMVIRIGAGVTVARGDLLMSAGDGTAKPQGDDIVRSKTIAKVTSTHISHTYADGSYAVPCVLMAC